MVMDQHSGRLLSASVVRLLDFPALNSPCDPPMHPNTHGVRFAMTRAEASAGPRLDPRPQMPRLPVAPMFVRGSVVVPLCESKDALL